MRKATTRRAQVVIGGSMAIVFSLPTTGCSRSSEPAIPVVMEVRPDQAVQVRVEDHKTTVELVRGGRHWTAAPGAPAGSAALMFNAEDRLLPLHGYRMLEADPTIPDFGLVNPDLRFSVTDRQGRLHTVAIGARTFNQGGFYANAVDEPERVYLVPTQAVGDLVSLVKGHPFTFPHPVDQVIRDELRDYGKPGEPTEAPWLQQAVRAGATVPDARAGGR